MSIEGGTKPSQQPERRPAEGHEPPGGREPFWDLKASHWVEVFLTLVLICIGWLQYTVYARQAGIMDRQADISETQNKIAMGGARAFIFVKEVPWAATTNEKGETAWHLRVSWKNNGTTQPKNLVMDTYCPNLSRKDDPTKLRPKDWPVLRGVMGPKQETFGGSCVPTTAELQAAQNHQKWFYIVATAVYDDVFGAQHVTEYCQVVDFIIGDLTKPNTSPLPSTSPCQKHNCADDECADRDEQIAAIRNARVATEDEPSRPVP